MKAFFRKLLLSFLYAALLFALIRLSKQEDYLDIHSRHFILVELALSWAMSFLIVILSDFLIDFHDRRKPGQAIEFLSAASLGCTGAFTVMLISHSIEGISIEPAETIIPLTIATLFTCCYYFWKRSHERERRLMEQSLKLEQSRRCQLSAELQLLRSQYHPHFLFNILNTVYVQINEADEAPRYTIECLSELLRYQLYSPDKPVSLRREADALGKYIELCRLRSSRKLQLNTNINVPENSPGIYPLLLLPLVENAFKFLGGDYRLSINLSADGDCICLHVTNSLPEIPAFHSGPSSSGLGLSNLRRRLELLYPGCHSLTTEKNASEFNATLKIKPRCQEK